ncbi:MAG: peptide-binding protein [Myxococcales bacterium]|nr:peptide-binding protein [Myxococcales bacterium]
MERIGRALAKTLAFAIAGSLAAVGTPAPARAGVTVISDGGPPEPGDWIIRHLSSEPGTLNPIIATDAYEGVVNQGIYETLLKRDNASLELIPLLATGWEIGDDKLTFTFHLRRDVRWHDGAPFTADDIVFSYERIQDPTVNAPHLRVYYIDIDRVEKLDDFTVRFHYKKPYFRALEFCGGLPIVPKHVFEKGDFNRNPAGRAPVGTGPYRFVRWATGKEIVLTRNDAYWGKPAPLERIVFRVITDDSAGLQVFKKRELDVIGLTPFQWERQTESARFERLSRKVSYYRPYYNYLGWNLRRPYFSDKRVRRALTQLVDRDKILAKLLYGLGKVVTGNFYVNSRDYDASIKPWPYDPPAAKKLLAEAGWIDHDGDGVLDKDGVAFRFTFIISAGSTFAEQLSTILKEELARVGIEMAIEKFEWAVFIDKIDGRDFDATSLGWSLGVESDPYQLWHSSQAEKGSNFVGFRNAEADRIIEAARIEFDADRRMKMYHRFHEILHEEQPYTFLFCTAALVAFDRRFDGVNLYPLGVDTLEWWTPVGERLYR